MTSVFVKQDSNRLVEVLATAERSLSAPQHFNMHSRRTRPLQHERAKPQHQKHAGQRRGHVRAQTDEAHTVDRHDSPQLCSPRRRPLANVLSRMFLPGERP